MSRPEGVHAGNWRTAPFSPWAFHHVDELLRTQAVPAGSGLPWVHQPASLEAFHLDLPDGTALGLERFLALTHTDALLIARDGALVCERYRNGHGADRRHALMSTSKALLGLVGSLLARRGDVRLDTPVAAYLPELAHTGYAGATLRNLLDMRAGVRLDARQQGAYEAAIHRDRTAPAAPGLHALLAAVPASTLEHGGGFDYLSAHSDVAAWAMERATGQPFAALASELLWRASGAQEQARLIVDGQGAAWAAGGWCTTARDLARVGHWLLHREPGLLDDLLHGGDPAAWRDGAWAQAFAGISRDMRYRAGWFAVHEEPGYLFAMGVHGQNLFIDPATGVVIVKLSSQPERVDGKLLGWTHQAARSLFRLVGAQARTVPG